MKANFLIKTLITLMLFSAFGQAQAADKKPADDFTLKSTLNGKPSTNVSLKEQRGKVVMLNFWASWCGPCREEMPLLNDMYNKYKKLGFTILGVNVEEDPSKGLKFLKDTPVDFPILHDTENTVSELYNVEAMPTTVLIDRNGNQRKLFKGYQTGYEKKYEKVVKKLVRE